MAKKATRDDTTTPLEKARDELYSHILRCGVLGALKEHQQEWLADTVEYMAERYGLSGDQTEMLRRLGERYCQPVIPHGSTVGAAT